MEDNFTEVERPLNFYLSCLEEQVRCELKDSKARLTQSTSEGRVILDIQEDSLATFLEQLQGQTRDNDWSHEKEQMQREICNLKALLEEAQTKNVHSSQTEIETLRYQLRKTKKILQRVKMDFEQQSTTTRDLQLQLEAMKTNKEALQKEEVQLACSKAEELEEDLKFEQAQNETLVKRLSEVNKTLQQHKEDAKKTVERSQASHRAQLEEEKQETNQLKVALKKAQDLLQTERLHFQQVKSSLEEKLDECHRSYLAQLDIEGQEKNELEAALKNVKEQKDDSESLQWQQERTSILEVMEKTRALYEAQLQQHKQDNSNLMAALKKADQKLESRRTEWHEERSSLLEATEKLEKTLQEKQQEWETTESCITSQLDQLQTKITKITEKRQRRKWFRRLF